MTGRILFVSAWLFAGSLAIAHASKTEPVPARAPLSTFPMRIAGWSGHPDMPFDKSILNVLRVDEYVNRVYTRSKAENLGLYIGYYVSQRQGDTIHSPLNCLPGAGWQPIRQETVSVRFPGRDAAAAEQVNRLIVENGAERQIVLYWYQLHGRIVASDYRSRAYLVLDALRLNRTDAAMIRVATPVVEAGNPSSEAGAADLAVAFAQSMYPYLGRYLPE